MEGEEIPGKQKYQLDFFIAGQSAMPFEPEAQQSAIAVLSPLLQQAIPPCFAPCMSPQQSAPCAIG